MSNERHTAEYLAIRHMVRVAACIACFGVFVMGYLVYIFSG